MPHQLGCKALHFSIIPNLIFSRLASCLVELPSFPLLEYTSATQRTFVECVLCEKRSAEITLHLG
ncbi:hypothetical protein COCSUDRAFT_33988, partial [Coccomyxa subellipsoidea C-169]